ncbi:MAG: hypothetical protein U0359_22525 [Byssovorax sp.]
MGAQLGGTFLIGAMGPVNYAGSCIVASRIDEGLRELVPDSLYGGVQRGVEAAAKRVGVPPREVERLLPMGELQMAAQRLALSQKRADDAWKLYAGQIGGLLKGVADLTADGRAPDVQLCLERLAKKLVRDKPLSEPIAALAVDIGAWVDLVYRCRDLLDDGAALERAYKRRRMIRILLGAGSAAAVLVVIAGLGWVALGRSAINKALDAADPCAVEALTEGTLMRGSSDQKQKVTEKLTACQDGRKREQQAREEQQRKDALAAEEARKKAEREGQCAALVKHVEGGALAPEDSATAGSSLALLKRVASRSLDAADLGPNDPSLPCGDTPSGAKLTQAFVRAVIAAPTLWPRAEEPSPFVTKQLGEHSAELPASLRQVAIKRADTTAQKALKVGTPLYVNRARRQCALKEALGAPAGSYCAAVTTSFSKVP